MEPMMTKVAEQVPNLAVLAFIVWMFLRYLKSERSAAEIQRSEQAAILARLNAESISAAKEAHGVVLANTMANVNNTNQLSANTASINGMTEHIREMNRNMRAFVDAQKNNSKG